MTQFEIETYEVRTTIRTAGPERFLELISPDLSHGIRHKAHLYFASSRPPFSDSSAVGVASNVGGLNYDGILFVVWADPDLFDEVYDMLRNESPTYLRYTLKAISTDPGNTYRWVTRIDVTTGQERPGEGPADGDAALAQVQMLLSAVDVGGDGAEHAVAELA